MKYLLILLIGIIFIGSFQTIMMTCNFIKRYYIKLTLKFLRKHNHQHMNLEELKKKSPAELILQAEKLEIENPSTLRKQEILFAILKKTCRKK